MTAEPRELRVHATQADDRNWSFLVKHLTRCMRFCQMIVQKRTGDAVGGKLTLKLKGANFSVYLFRLCTMKGFLCRVFSL